MLLRAALIWLLLVVLAVMNGWLRDTVVTPRFGEHAGHLVSTVTLGFLIAGGCLPALQWVQD